FCENCGKNRLKSQKDEGWKLSFVTQPGTHAYAWKSARSPCICVACNNQVSPGPKLPRICGVITQPSMHMRGKLPHHVPSHVWKEVNVTLSLTSLSEPRICAGSKYMRGQARPASRLDVTKHVKLHVWTRRERHEGKEPTHMRGH
ncbi:hypothetical protein PIB30_111296, partial [Stylosanthes scabra]|nr:hypothetical protein [Stylosanthes scabra]